MAAGAVGGYFGARLAAAGHDVSFIARGALLDSLVDDASNLLFFAALSVGVATSTHSDWPLAAGLVCAICYVGVIVAQ